MKFSPLLIALTEQNGIEEIVCYASRIAVLHNAQISPGIAEFCPAISRKALCIPHSAIGASEQILERWDIEFTKSFGWLLLPGSRKAIIDQYKLGSLSSEVVKIELKPA